MNFVDFESNLVYAAFFVFDNLAMNHSFEKMREVCNRKNVAFTKDEP